MNFGQKADPGLPGFFGTLSHLRTTVRRTIEGVWNIEKLAQEQRTLASLALNETFRHHLSLLHTGDGAGPAEISYSLDQTSRLLQPQITENGVDKRIIVATVALGEDYARTVGRCLESQAAYCQERGFAYARLVRPPSRLHRHPSWYKIPLAYKLMKLGYSDVFYLDADAMITNAETPLSPFFKVLAEQDQTLLVAEDDDGANMGVFFLRGGSDAVRLLDLLWLYDLGNDVWEQAALKSLLTSYAQVRAAVGIAASAKAFNSFPVERAEQMKIGQENNWTPGDFVCHFSGLRNPLLGSLIERYATQPPPAFRSAAA